MKWPRLKMFSLHLLPSLIGFGRELTRQPVFTFRLAAVRLRFFFTRQFAKSLVTPTGFQIETATELISYWSFFVERETWRRDWLDALAETAYPLVVDVGANAGLFTHLIWTLRPDAEIIAFEPLPKMREKLHQWQIRTQARLTIRPEAVSDHSGTASFYTTADNDTGASLNAGQTKYDTFTVPLTTLDLALAGRTSLLIKIDAEGVEPEVLAGAKDTLSRVKYLILEAHTPEALQKINFILGAEWRSRRVGSSDYLFVRKPDSKSNAPG